jgi:hypothetical protein
MEKNGAGSTAVALASMQRSPLGPPRPEKSSPDRIAEAKSLFRLQSFLKRQLSALSLD